MHSFLHRVYALLMFSVTILAIMCGVASLTDSFHVTNPSADVKISKVNRFRNLRGNDEVSLTLNISADLDSLFTWNTKQVFVFVAAEYATPKNGFNQGSNLRDAEFNMTMHWQVMPKTGKMSVGKILMTGYRLPQSYR